MWKIIVLCVVIMGLAADGITIYENYKVYSIVPTTALQLGLLITKFNDNEFKFWQRPHRLYTEVILMVHSKSFWLFEEIMHAGNFKYNLKIHDVQELIEKTMPQNQSQGFDFNSYHPLEEIYDYLEALQTNYSDKVAVMSTRRSGQFREVMGVRIEFGKHNPGVVLEGGIMAREWISPASVMYILHQLLTSNDTNVRYIADNHNWFIFPVLNPDGYDYTFNTDRLWQKNRSKSRTVTGQDCYGTNLNRNWQYQWETNSDKNPCSEEYRGYFENSEDEVNTMSEFLGYNLNKYYAYISFHGFQKRLLYPYGFTHQYSAYYDDLRKICLLAVEVLKQKYHIRYVTGRVSDFRGLTSGINIDFVAGTYSKPLTLIYESHNTNHYFLLPSEEIIPAGQRAMDFLIAVLTQARKYNYHKN